MSLSTSQPLVSARSPESLIARRCVAGRLRMATRRVTALYDDALRPHGLTLAQLNILVVLARLQPVRSARIAAELQLEKSTLSRSLARMKERDWIASSAAGRGGALRVKPRGRAVLLAALPAWETAQQQARELLGASGVLAISQMASRLRAQAPAPASDT